MGHLNLADLKQLSSLADGFVFTGEASNNCLPCLQMKNTRSPHPVSTTRSTWAGQLIHIDIGIINHYSINGYTSYLILVDDYSRFVTIECLETPQIRSIAVSVMSKNHLFHIRRRISSRSKLFVDSNIFYLL